jgi:hypothetical protein
MMVHSYNPSRSARKEKWKREYQKLCLNLKKKKKLSKKRLGITNLRVVTFPLIL